jgi:hypothetical protein
VSRSVVFLLLLCAGAYAATAASFLDNGLGARSEGLARTFTAVADDLDAFYYNPAGYGLQKKTRANTLFARNRNIESVYYAGYGSRLGRGYAAFNLYSSSIDGIPVMELDSKNRPVDTGQSFSAVDRVFVFSYGRPLDGLPGSTELGASALSWGVSVKYIQQTLYDNHASGAGLDAGLLYRTGPLTAGWSVINLLEPQLAWDTDSGAVGTVKRQQRFGLAYRILPELLASGELVLRENDVLTGLGVEYTLRDIFALRGGIFTEHYVLGLGLVYAGISLDYAYLIPLDYLVDPTQKISLGYVF